MKVRKKNDPYKAEVTLRLECERTLTDEDILSAVELGVDAFFFKYRIDPPKTKVKIIKLREVK